MTRPKYIPQGWPVLIPRIVGRDPQALVSFIKHVFDATGSFNEERPSELRMGDSMLMISGSTDRDEMPAFLYVGLDGSAPPWWTNPSQSGTCKSRVQIPNTTCRSTAASNSAAVCVRVASA